jgi:transposase
MPAAAALLITPDDLAELHRWARSAQLPAVLVQRARILLLAADGAANTEIAQRVGVSRPTVIACRRRYVRRGLEGLPDRPRPGRPQTVRRFRRAEILSATLNPPPPRLGITHWSTRLLARELGVSRDTIARIWREHGVQPWRVGTFKSSTDPELAAKVHDVVGLYLHPPDRAVVLCVDEKAQIQAVERTQPVRRVWPGGPERRTHDYIRHGTTTLFAALEVATGRVTNRCAARHRHQEFLGFLKQLARTYPRRRLHLVCDNYATHKHPRSAPGSPATPASSCTSPRPRRPGSTWSRCSSRSWNVRRCAAATSPASPTSSPRSVASVPPGNQRCQRFSWTKSADEILTKLNRQTTSATQH